MAASCRSGTHPADLTGEGDRVAVPPADPVRTPDNEVLGGFQTTSDEIEAAPHTEVLGGPPDEALAGSVTRELRENAATAALIVDVTCFEGVVTPRGTVDDLIDAENAQAVAARVPGVRGVLDELRLRSNPA